MKINYIRNHRFFNELRRVVCSRVGSIVSLVLLCVICAFLMYFFSEMFFLFFIEGRGNMGLLPILMMSCVSLQLFLTPMSIVGLCGRLNAWSNLKRAFSRYVIFFVSINIVPFCLLSLAVTVHLMPDILGIFAFILSYVVLTVVIVFTVLSMIRCLIYVATFKMPDKVVYWSIISSTFFGLFVFVLLCYMFKIVIGSIFLL